MARKERSRGSDHSAFDRTSRIAKVSRRASDSLKPDSSSRGGVGTMPSRVLTPKATIINMGLAGLRHPVLSPIIAPSLRPVAHDTIHYLRPLRSRVIIVTARCPRSRPNRLWFAHYSFPYGVSFFMVSGPLLGHYCYGHAMRRGLDMSRAYLTA